MNRKATASVGLLIVAGVAATIAIELDNHGSTAAPSLFSCPDEAAPASLDTATSQAQYYRPGPSSITEGASTQLFVFEFSSDSAVRATFEELKSDFGSCDAGSHYAAGTSRLLKDSVTISALIDTGFASVHTFRNADDTEAGSPIGIASDTHEYFVQRGTFIEALRVNGDSYIDNSAADMSTLNSLASCLNSSKSSAWPSDGGNVFIGGV